MSLDPCAKFREPGILQKRKIALGVRPHVDQKVAAVRANACKPLRQGLKALYRMLVAAGVAPAAVELAAELPPAAAELFAVFLFCGNAALGGGEVCVLAPADDDLRLVCANVLLAMVCKLIISRRGELVN